MFARHAAMNFSRAIGVKYIVRRTVFRASPAVYRFVCPDGRSYVGSAKNIEKRPHAAVDRENPRLLKAFKKYPPETWRFEILETLPPRMSSGRFAISRTAPH